MKNNDVQVIAETFLKETDLTVFMVKDTQGNDVLLIHLLTDFYKRVELERVNIANEFIKKRNRLDK